MKELSVLRKLITISCMLVFFVLLGMTNAYADSDEDQYEATPGAGVEFDTEEEQQQPQPEDGVPGPGGGNGKEWYQLPQTGHLGNFALQSVGLIVLSGTIYVFQRVVRSKNK